MSENIPESVPTSSDRRSGRPAKKQALTPTTQQSSQIEALFARPDRALSPNGQKPKNPNLPPEIVANVQGSSAGAGSGEFHVYKASRRREYERLRAMDEEKTKEEEDARFVAERGEAKKKDEEKTNKNRARREKAKMRKGKKGAGGDTMEVDETNGAVKAVATKPKLKPNAVGSGGQEFGTKQSGHDEDGQEVRTEEAGIIIHDDD